MPRHHGSVPGATNFETLSFVWVPAACSPPPTLDGGALLAAQAQPVRDWHAAMQGLPAVAAYLRERPQPGTGEVGRPGSLLFEHKRPWERV